MNAVTRPVHPGKTLAAEMKSRGMDFAQTLEKTRLPEDRLKNFLNGKAMLDASDLKKIVDVFGSSVQFWVNMQRTYMRHGGA